MADRLIWSPRALAELEDIADYIAKDSPLYARMVVRRIIERTGVLPDMPGQGRRVPDYQGPLELREVFAYDWRMIYAVKDGRVEIVTVFHGARSMENLPPL